MEEYMKNLFLIILIVIISSLNLCADWDIPGRLVIDFIRFNTAKEFNKFYYDYYGEQRDFCEVWINNESVFWSGNNGLKLKAKENARVTVIFYDWRKIKEIVFNYVIHNVGFGCKAKISFSGSYIRVTNPFLIDFPANRSNVTIGNRYNENTIYNCQRIDFDVYGPNILGNIMKNSYLNLQNIILFYE